MPSAGLCVRFLLYLTLIIYCPENFIIIFIKKVVFDNRTFERVPGYSLPSLIISNTQKGRFMGENTRFLYDLMHYLEEMIWMVYYC